MSRRDESAGYKPLRIILDVSQIATTVVGAVTLMGEPSNIPLGVSALLGKYRTECGNRGETCSSLVDDRIVDYM